MIESPFRPRDADARCSTDSVVTSRITTESPSGNVMGLFGRANQIATCPITRAATGALALVPVS